MLSYTGGKWQAYAGQSIASTGITGLMATLAPGNFAVGAGSVTYTILGTPSGTGSASFATNIGGITCVLTRTVYVGAPKLTVENPTYQGVSVIDATGIGYNGEAVPGASTITVQLTSETARSYTLSATDAATGLVYSASGSLAAAGTYPVVLTNNGVTIDPFFSGVITMPLTGADNTINLLPRIDVKSIPASATNVLPVNLGNGQIFMDRNLGARRAAIAIDDVFAYGNHYQWGRPADGHEITVWNGTTKTAGRGFYGTTATLSATDAPTDNKFFTTNRLNF